MICVVYRVKHSQICYTHSKVYSPTIYRVRPHNEAPEGPLKSSDPTVRQRLFKVLVEA